MSEIYPIQGDHCLEWEGTESQSAGNIIYKSANVFRYNYHIFCVTEGGMTIEVSLNGADWFPMFLTTSNHTHNEAEIRIGEIGVLQGKFKFIRVLAQDPNSNAHGTHGCN